MSAVETLELNDLPALERARALWARQKWEAAEREFIRVAEEHPRNWHALIDVARVLGDRQEIRRSREWLDRLSALATGRDDLLLQLAQTCRMSRREDEAVALLERYVKGPGKRDPAGHLELAVLHERRHRLDAAEESALAALRAAPHWLESLIILARVRRQRGEDERATAALRRIVRAPRAHPYTRAQAWVMLAELADRTGDAAAAMKRLETAKSLLRPAAVGLVAQAMTALRAWDRTCRDLTPECAFRWATVRPEPGAPLPAHLAGFPRSGTTLLENILDAHSEVVSSEESQVLGRDLLGVLWREPGQDIPPSIAALDAVPDLKLSALRARYWARLGEGLGDPAWPRVHLDKNPTHTLFIPGILRMLPDSRFLIALRDPRDVVVSCYFQYFPLNPHSACFLTWEDSIRRYRLDLEAWLRLREALPPERWIEVRYEDVVADLPALAARALAFLGLPWEAAVLDYRDRVAEKTVHTPSYLDVQRPVHSGAVGRWQKYARWMEPHLDQLRPLTEALGYRW